MMALYVGFFIYTYLFFVFSLSKNDIPALRLLLLLKEREKLQGRHSTVLSWIYLHSHNLLMDMKDPINNSGVFC